MALQGAIFLLAVFSTAPAAQSPQIVATPEQRAAAFLDLIVKQDFVAAADTFDDTLRAALPQDRLHAAWLSTLQQVGAFRKSIATNVSVVDGLTTATVTCEFERRTMDVQIAFGPDDRVTGFFVRPTPPPWKAPAYATPAAYTETATSIGTGEWSLPATITIPKGAGPFPAVVLVHGSGPQDRDESIGPNKPLRDLAVGLASRGIAVLRFEKRTKQYAATLATRKVTVNDESIDDAFAAIDRLRAIARIDRGRIVVLGHGTGGMVIPRIGAADRSTRRIAGFIVLAGPARPLEELALIQARSLAIADGTVTPGEQAHIDERQRAAERIHALTAADADDLTLISGAPASYWLDLRGYDPPTVAKTLTAPMLVLQGERDYEVTMDDYGKWKAALGSERRVTWHSYPALDHLFIAGRGPSLPAEYMIAGHVDAAVIRDIANWIGMLRAQ